MLQSVAQDSFRAGLWLSGDPPSDGCLHLSGMFLDEQAVPSTAGAFGSTLFGVSTTDQANLLWSGRLAGGDRIIAGTTSETWVSAVGGAAVALGVTVPRPSRAAVMGASAYFGNVQYAGSLKAADYTTGTVSVVNGSKTVTGVGTAFVANTDAGMLLKVDAVGGGSFVVPVESVTDNTHVQLYYPWPWATTAGGTYALKRTEPRGVTTNPVWGVVANRVVQCAGNRLYFSSLASPLVPPTFLNQAEDQHEFPDGAQILGVEGLGDTAYVFTTAGVYTISNMRFDLTDDAGNLQQIVGVLSRDLRLLGDAGLAQWNGAVLAACTDGAYMIPQGSAPVLLSRSIAPAFNSFLGDPPLVSPSAVYRGHWFLPLSFNSQIVVYVCRLDMGNPNRGVWPWSSSNLQHCYATCRTATVNQLLAGQRSQLNSVPLVLDATGLLDPDYAPTSPQQEASLMETSLMTVGPIRNGGMVREATVRYSAGATPHASAAVNTRIGEAGGVVHHDLTGDITASTQHGEHTWLVGARAHQASLSLRFEDTRGGRVKVRGVSLSVRRSGRRT
jgi:hypothetical protein